MHIFIRALRHTLFSATTGLCLAAGGAEPPPEETDRQSHAPKRPKVMLGIRDQGESPPQQTATDCCSDPSSALHAEGSSESRATFSAAGCMGNEDTRNTLVETGGAALDPTSREVLLADPPPPASAIPPRSRVGIPPSHQSWRTVFAPRLRPGDSAHGTSSHFNFTFTFITHFKSPFFPPSHRTARDHAPQRMEEQIGLGCHPFGGRRS